MELVLKEKATFLDAGDLVKYKDEYCLIAYDDSDQYCWILVSIHGEIVNFFEAIEHLAKSVELIAKSNKLKLVVEE